MNENLNIGVKVLVLAERIRKRSAPGKLYTTLCKTLLTLIEKRHFLLERNKKYQMTYYWLKNLQNNRDLTKRFQRTELFAVNTNFTM